MVPDEFCGFVSETAKVDSVDVVDSMDMTQTRGGLARQSRNQRVKPRMDTNQHEPEKKIRIKIMIMIMKNARLKIFSEMIDSQT